MVQHECFVCGRFGTDGIDVYKCCGVTSAAATGAGGGGSGSAGVGASIECGRFYHAYCVGLSDDDLSVMTAPLPPPSHQHDGSTAPPPRFVCPKHTCATCHLAFDPRKDIDVIDGYRCIFSWQSKCAQSHTALSAADSKTAAAGTSPHPMQQLLPHSKRWIRCGRHGSAPAPVSMAVRSAARTTFVTSAVSGGKLTPEQADQIRVLEAEDLTRSFTEPGALPPLPVIASGSTASPRKRQKPSPAATGPTPAAALAAAKPIPPSMRKAIEQSDQKHSSATSNVKRSPGRPPRIGASGGAGTTAANHGSSAGGGQPPSAAQVWNGVHASGYDSESEFISTPLGRGARPAPTNAPLPPGVKPQHTALSVWRALGMENNTTAYSTLAKTVHAPRLMGYVNAIKPAAPTVWTDPMAFAD